MSIWNGVEEFVMVAHTGSFTVSARRLNVSTSHISRQIQALEDRLGVKLLSRTTRTVKLTDMGSVYLNTVEDLIAGLDEANQRIAGAFADLSGLVRVSAAGPFAENIAMPALLEFAEQNPKISLEVDINNRNVNLVEEGFDFAVRYGVLADSSLIARKLATRILACAASPAYLERYGEPALPLELRQHSCIISNRNTWQFQDPNSSKAVTVKVSGKIRTNSMPLMRMAVAKGFGVTYTPIENIQDMIDSGQVCRILQGYEDQSRSHWVVYPERRFMPLRVRAAIEYLMNALASERR